MTTLLILKTFSHLLPSPVLFQPCYPLLKLITNQMNSNHSNLIALNWNYHKSKTAWNSSWRKTKVWLLYQHINKKSLAKNVTILQNFAITWTLTRYAKKIDIFIISKFSSFYFAWVFHSRTVSYICIYHGLLNLQTCKFRRPCIYLCTNNSLSL